MSDTEYSSPWPSHNEAVENAIHQKDEQGRMPIHYRAQAKGVKMLEKILEIDESHLDIIDDEGHTPLIMAIIAGSNENAEFFLDRNANIDHQDYDKHSVVHYAVENAQLRVLKRLLRMNAKVGVSDKTGAQPLHYATRLREAPPEVCQEILVELLRAGANPNARDIDSRTPILWAAIHGNVDAMNAIIEGGGNKLAVDRDQLGVLHCSANYGHAQVIEYILDNTDRDIVHWKDKNGNTPIFYAASNGHSDCAGLLLQHETNPNDQDKRLRTPSHCAASRGHLKILQLLILKQYGASFEFGNYCGDLPIHEAIQSKSIPCVEYLLRMQPNAINASNYKGRTPLHLSAACENLEMISLLCGKGANVNPLMLNKNRLLTPLDIAKLRKNEEIIALLREQNALEANEFPEDELDLIKSSIKDTYITAHLNRPPFKEISCPEQEPLSKQLRMRSGDVKKSSKAKMEEYSRRSSSIDSEQPNRTQKCTSTSDLPQSRQSLRLGADAESKIRKIIHEELANSARKKSMDKRLHIDLDESSISPEAPLKKEHIRMVSSHAPRKKSKTNGGSSNNREDHHAASYVDADEAIFDKETDLRKIRKALYGSEAHSDSEMPSEGSAKKERKMVEFDEKQLFDNDWKKISKIKRSVGQQSQLRMIHEKAIFQELTHLKRIQLQYGKVQEKILVRSLVSNFCKMHGLNPAYFKYQSFYAWEKFLYGEFGILNSNSCISRNGNGFSAATRRRSARRHRRGRRSPTRRSRRPSCRS
ncbi:hypothetical protein L596_005091 [Steinernema carpocapsae]|uniref:Uncharacterized protein n=1 Tax=Steinernema carpocapsae TaxID=34508 RepID=A0A4U8UZD8_STECR|nr:hypothetical protein L596_005091 [Steinernema carpocapsae]